jgi:hypothetical protein
VPLALRFTETTDPSDPRVVGSVPPEDMVHLIDEAQCESTIGCVARSLLELQEVADGEGVGPQVACRRLFSNQTRALSANMTETLTHLRITVGRWKVRTHDDRERLDDT